MPLRRKILLSFFGVIALGLAQMFNTVVALSGVADHTARVGESQLLSQRIVEVTEFTSAAERLQNELLTRQAYRMPIDATLTAHGDKTNRLGQVLADLKQLVPKLSTADRDDIIERVDTMLTDLQQYQTDFARLVSRIGVAGGDPAADSLIRRRRDVDDKLPILISSLDDKSPELAKLLYQLQSLWSVVKAGANPDELNQELKPREVRKLNETLTELQRRIEADTPLASNPDITRPVQQIRQEVDAYLQVLGEIGLDRSGIVGGLRARAEALRSNADAMTSQARAQVEFSSRQLLEEMNRRRTAAVIFGSVALIIGVGIAFLLTREIIKPIEEFRIAADRVSRGDPNVILPEPKTQDEIAELSRSFQRMLNSLRALLAQDDDLRSH